MNSNSNKFPSIDQIKEDLSFLSNYEVVIYGSYAKQEYIEGRSDIDVAVITRNNDEKNNLQLWNSLIGKFHPLYEIRIFELFSLYLQIEVIKHYLVLFGDRLEISEYFYEFRKIWNDMEYRVKENQFQNIDEMLEGIERRKKLLKKLKEKNDTDV